MALLLLARFHACPGCQAALREAIQTVTDPTRLEPGCLSYQAFQSVRLQGEFYVHSRWRATKQRLGSSVTAARSSVPSDGRSAHRPSAQRVAHGASAVTPNPSLYPTCASLRLSPAGALAANC